MRTETLLDAMVQTEVGIVGYENMGWRVDYRKLDRQRKAFRARILARDAEQRQRMNELEVLITNQMQTMETWKEKYAAQRQRIAELEKIDKVQRERIREQRAELDAAKDDKKFLEDNMDKFTDLKGGGDV